MVAQAGLVGLSEFPSGHAVGPGVPAREESRETVRSHVLVCLERSMATDSLETLEQVVSQASPTRRAALFDAAGPTDEMAVLQTCQRLELYFWTDQVTDVEHAVSGTFLGEPGWRRHQGHEAVEHLFRVTAGLESTAVGETEVRAQVRAAAHEVRSRHPRAVLKPLFLRAVRSAEQATGDRPTGPSIASLAAAEVIEQVGVSSPRILVVGTGVVGREVAERLVGHGKLTLVFRARPPEERFRRACSARAAPWGDLEKEVGLADAMVTAVKSDGRLLQAEDFALRDRPLLIVDLGLPRNVDPAAASLPFLHLVDLGTLRSRAPKRAPLALERLVTAEGRNASGELAAVGYESRIAAYRRSVERLRQELVGQAHESLSARGILVEDELDRLTDRLLRRVLDGPTRGLRSIPPGPEGEAIRRWAEEFLRADRART